MVIKLIILATLITLLHSFAPEVLFEKIFMFHPLKPLFVLGDNTVHEWWFRWSIDRYVSHFTSSELYVCNISIASFNKITSSSNHGIAMDLCDMNADLICIHITQMHSYTVVA